MFTNLRTSINTHCVPVWISRAVDKNAVYTGKILGNNRKILGGIINAEING